MENFKLSQLNLEFIKDYLKVDYTDDDRELELYIQASLSFIKNNTRLSIEELDEKPDLVVVAMMLISHFYENKSVAVKQGSNVDKMFTSILAQYRECF